MELRCDTGKVLFGNVSEGATGTIDVSCRGKWCGKAPGVVVVHRFDLATGEVIKTEKFSEPNIQSRQPKTRSA